MARKKAVSASATSDTEETQAINVVEPVVRANATTEALEPVKVNNANTTELKIALDDAVKRVSL